METTMLVLVSEKNGRRVRVGETVTTFRGEQAKLVRTEWPRHSGSTGRVYIEEDGQLNGYYPSVIGAKWVEAPTKPIKLTPEEKERWARILSLTYQGIAPDVEPLLEGEGVRKRQAIIIELTLDAHRPLDYGMTIDEYDVLCLAADHPDTKRWLRLILNY